MYILYVKDIFPCDVVPHDMIKIFEPKEGNEVGEEEKNLPDGVVAVELEQREEETDNKNNGDEEPLQCCQRRHRMKK